MNIRKDRRFVFASSQTRNGDEPGHGASVGLFGKRRDRPRPGRPLARTSNRRRRKPGWPRIASVNSELGFAVVDFAAQTMPPVGTRVNVYRGDKRVGTVRITEPVHAPLATADVVDGEVRVGDEAR